MTSKTVGLRMWLAQGLMLVVDVIQGWVTKLLGVEAEVDDEPAPVDVPVLDKSKRYIMSLEGEQGRLPSVEVMLIRKQIERWLQGEIPFALVPLSYGFKLRIVACVDDNEDGGGGGKSSESGGLDRVGVSHTKNNFNVENPDRV